MLPEHDLAPGTPRGRVLADWPQATVTAANGNGETRAHETLRRYGAGNGSACAPMASVGNDQRIALERDAIC